VGDFTLTQEEIDFARALAYYAQGLILEQELGGNSAEAMEEFAKAAELDPNRSILSAKAAMIALQRRQPDSAIAILEKAHKANPHSARTLLDLASICQAAGRADDAAKYYARVIELDKTSTFAYLSLARLRFERKLDADALTVLREGAQDEKKKAAILAFCYGRGREFMADGEISRAIPCFQLMAQHSPALRPQLYSLLGELYEGLGDEEEAIRHFTLATQEQFPLSDAFVKLALLELKSDSNKALETLLRAESLSPKNPAVLLLLAFAYSAQERFTDAIAVYDRALPILEKSDKERLSPSFYLYYGGACERAGQAEKAESVFEKGLTQYPDDDAMLNYLAYMWAEAGVKLDKAETYVTKALEKEPNSGAYADTLGWIYFKQKKYKDALTQIQRARELVKNDAVVTDHLGDVFNALEDKEQALSLWKQSFLLDPDSKTVAVKLESGGVNVEKLRKEARKTNRQMTKGNP